MFGLFYKTFARDLTGNFSDNMAAGKPKLNLGENLVHDSFEFTHEGTTDAVATVPTSKDTTYMIGQQLYNQTYDPFTGMSVVCGNTTCNPEYEICVNDGNTSVCNGTYHDALSYPNGPNLFSLEENGEMNRFTLPVYGYVSPALVVFTIITNTLVCVVLMKKNMRSPTNLLLVGMALSDMFTGVFPIPCFIYFYTLERYRDWVPYNWCLLYNALTDFIPTIFHTASIFLTVALAGQRYIYVCHSIKARQFCTMTNSVKTIVVIYVISVLLHLCRFLETVYTPVEVTSLLNPQKTITACATRFTTIVDRHANIYFNVYFWVRVLFIHIVPCVTLVLLNLLLILAMKSAQERRKQLLKQNRRTESRKLKENNCTTLMLISVVGLFLLVEIPLAVLLIIMIIENTFDMAIVPPSHQAEAGLLINFFILLSYPVNFFIYCGMSRQFRETFKRLFIPGAIPLDREHSQYMSLATENGGKNVVKTEETGV